MAAHGSSIDWDAVIDRGISRARRRPPDRPSIPNPFEARLLTWNQVQPLIARGDVEPDLLRVGVIALSEIAVTQAEGHNPWADRKPKALEALNREVREDRRLQRIALLNERARDSDFLSLAHLDRRRVFAAVVSLWPHLFEERIGDAGRRTLTLVEVERELLKSAAASEDGRTSPRRHDMPPRQQFALMHATLDTHRRKPQRTKSGTPARRSPGREAQRETLEIFSGMAAALVRGGRPSPYLLLVELKTAVFPPLFFAGGPAAQIEDAPSPDAGRTLVVQGKALQRLVEGQRQRARDPRGRRALKHLQALLARLPRTAR